MDGRRAVFYGKLPPGLVERLAADYGVEVVLNAAQLRESMLSVLRHEAYDLLVIEAQAANAEKLAAVVRQQRQIPVVLIPADQDMESARRAVLETTGWGRANKTAFIVDLCIKGGVGKTTTGAALGEIFSLEQHRRVLVVNDNPHQQNLLSFYGKFQVPTIPPEALRTPGESLARYITPVHENLDLVAPEVYLARGGLSYGAARNFWATVSGLGYDLVLVDTSPSPMIPEALDEWTDVDLTFALLTGEFPAVFITPFTPDPWGHEGLETTRNLLERRQQLPWMIPVAVATDALHVVENVPAWLRSPEWEGRFCPIHYNRRLKERPRAEELEPRKIWGVIPLHDARSFYRPLAQQVLALTERRLQVGGGRC